MPKDFTQIDWDEALDDDCRQIVRLAVREDLDRRVDLTTVSLVEKDVRGTASFVSREAGTAAGLRAIETALDEMEVTAEWLPRLNDGDAFAPKTCLAEFSGSARDMLTAERVLLNFVGKLSGIATRTRQYVDRVAGTKARIYDTRKTTPGWRRLEKYAVRCGGGWNHRTGLYDAVLIKDNHLAIAGRAGTLAEAVDRARRFVREALGDEADRVMIEIEVDTLEQFEQILPTAPDVVLLDNMTPQQLGEAVRRRDAAGVPTELEASGGVNFDTVRAIAESGVDRISIGALTHAARWLDIGLDWNVRD